MRSAEDTSEAAILVQPMPAERTPLIASDDHLAHTGLVELVAGQEVPCFESPERATAIRDALLANGGYALQEPREHGPDPITAVHDLELLDLVEHAWTDAMADGRMPRAACDGFGGRRPIAEGRA